MVSMFWPPDSPWAPFWTTKPNIARQMCKLAGVSEKTIVYELGCGTATILTTAAKEFGAPGVGIEIDPLRFAISWFNVTFKFKVGDRITLIRDSFFNVSFKEGDIFCMYLIPRAIRDLVPKFLKECKSGSIFVSYVYEFPIDLFKGKLKLIKHDKENRLFLYKLNS